MTAIRCTRHCQLQSVTCNLAVLSPAPIMLIAIPSSALTATSSFFPPFQGDRLRATLDSLNGQALMLSALLVLAPKLPLGLPSR